MEEVDFMRIMIFVMFFLWLIYPYIIIKLRPKIFDNVSEGNVRYTNLFIYYCFIIGFSTTIGTFIILSLFNGDRVSFEGMIKGVLVGLISETIILFPDKLEKIFKINLKSTESMMKFIFIYLISFVIILELINQFLL